jgi:hypothetical protein
MKDGTGYVGTIEARVGYLGAEQAVENRPRNGEPVSSRLGLAVRLSGENRPQVSRTQPSTSGTP